jgi:hypothetical protein
MGMTRQERIALHKKQERSHVSEGAPSASDLKEGVPVIRKTAEGLVEFIKFENQLHKKVLTKI